MPNLKNVPQEERTYDVCLTYVKDYGQNLRYVSNEHKTYDLCLVAVQNDGYAIQFISPKKLNESEKESLFIEAIKNDHLSIKYVVKLWTPSIHIYKKAIAVFIELIGNYEINDLGLEILDEIEEFNKHFSKTIIESDYELMKLTLKQYKNAIDYLYFLIEKNEVNPETSNKT